ncbi:MAG: DUF2382 domain-containing protein, partial [Fibrella sp.]|nr:DUF2382 domain-containing protein [Armatimonadota bacterium]
MTETVVLTPGMNEATRSVAGDERVIPVVEETLRVHKGVVQSGGVRIVKSVVMEEATIEEPTIREA